MMLHKKGDVMATSKNITVDLKWGSQGFVGPGRAVSGFILLLTNSVWIIALAPARLLKEKKMPPNDSVKIMVNWEEPLIIDVLRQMDADAEAAGRVSITSYLITLMPKEKASRIMYLMTQL